MQTFNDLLDKLPYIPQMVADAYPGDSKARAQVVSALVNAHATHALAEAIKSAGEDIRQGLKEISNRIR
jgi:hypothetical protein